MKNVTVSAPWYEFNRKAKALFERDLDINVGDIAESVGGKYSYGFNIEVKNDEKYRALAKVMPKERQFGNVWIMVNVYNGNEEKSEDDLIGLYETIFDGNDIVKDIKDVKDVTGTRHGFIRFRPEVVQFFNDDISDYNGNWSGLAQDIARDLFAGDHAGVHFCTAGVNEND